MSSALHYQTLTETLQQLQAGELSSVELTQHMLDRISALDGDLHAYCTVLAESALEQAQRMDERRAAGQSPGTLQGVPIAVKDLFATAGVVTASGTTVMSDHVPREDAWVVARLEQAGAVMLGKVQLTEGAYGNHHPEICAPVNPWNAKLWSGVSSSGSGVSVAAGMAFGALGSDTGGSIRFPSAANHLVGIKPTYGRVSRRGAFPLAESLDHVGPMARSVADAACLLQVIAGFDERDATAIDADVPSYLQALAQDGDGLAGLTIGVDWRYVESGVAASVVGTVNDALHTFAELGAAVVDVTMPAEYEPLVSHWVITCAVECALAHQDYFPKHRARYGPDLRRLIELGRRCGAIQYSTLERLRERFRAGFSALFDNIDVLICPTMPTAVPTNEEMAARAEQGDVAADFLTFTAPFNYSGHPTITLPAGLDADGVPTSFQLVGDYLDEATLLRFGYAFERAGEPSEHPNL